MTNKYLISQYKSESKKKNLTEQDKQKILKIFDELGIVIKRETFIDDDTPYSSALITTNKRKLVLK